MTSGAPTWIPAGTRFGEAEMTFYQGKGERDLDDVLGEIDLVVTGPHATAAFPAEMQPFVAASLTERLQWDFSDVTTSPIAQRWAALDAHVLYIEDPHPRAVRDANRARPDDTSAKLREAFARLAAEPGGRPSLAGVDAIRPVTFGYLPVLVRPVDESGWTRLGESLAKAGTQGIDEYERVRDDLIERVVEAKLRRLHALDPARTSAAEWSSATHLDVLSIHDTMNHTARPDGAVCLERPPADRLPNVVALSNLGDSMGELRASDDAALRTDTTVPTMEPARLRAIGMAYRHAFDAWDPDDVGFNRPYLGGYETQLAGPKLRTLSPLAVVRPNEGPPRALRMGAWQNEFLREFLLGEESTATMMQPGDEWAPVPGDRVQWIAERLTAAHDLVRRWGNGMESTAR